MQTAYDTKKINRYLLALANVERLQIIAQLIQTPLSIAELSAATGLQPSEIIRHLDFLINLDLVEDRTDQEGKFYAYKDKTMETLIKSQAPVQEPPVATPWDGMPEESRRRISNLLTSDGRLEYIPSQPKKLLPILEHVAGAFEKGMQYSEKEVNTLLEKFTRDTSTLRRFLIDHGYLGRTRDGARYWRK